MSLWEILFRMDLDLRTSFLSESCRDDYKWENMDFKPSQTPALQKVGARGVSGFQITQLSLFQNSNNSCARQTLQRLCKSCHSWLQPENQQEWSDFSSVLEQFMISRYCSDSSTLKEEWESCGRNLETLMEDVSGDCVRMQRQEVLFSDVPLREIIVHLTKQLPIGSQQRQMWGHPSGLPKISLCKVWRTRRWR